MPTTAVKIPMTAHALEACISQQPRVNLAHLPTPLDEATRLSAALGGPRIFIKRDDMTGLACGGNKTRQLEFLFAQIIASGADTVVAGAYSQSNWCRQICAAACKLGLKAVLCLVAGEKGDFCQGNLLLDYLLGAEVKILELDSSRQLQPHLEEIADTLRANGRNPYIISPFDLDILACSAIGYVGAVLEMERQQQKLGIKADYIYLSGANITPAGLVVGLRALGCSTQVVGITPIEWQEDRATDIAKIAAHTAQQLGLHLHITADDIINDGRYIGERYGKVTAQGLEAMHLVATTEGILLDPVYSGKAMAGLIDHIKTGQISSDKTVIFLHTGGIPALFAYAQEVLPQSMVKI